MHSQFSESDTSGIDYNAIDTTLLRKEVYYCTVCILYSTHFFLLLLVPVLLRLQDTVLFTRNNF